MAQDQPGLVDGSVQAEDLSAYRLGPIGWLVMAWMAGLVAGGWFGSPWVWLGIAIVALLGAIGARPAGRGRWVRPLITIAVICSGAAWYATSADYVSADHVSQWVTAEPQLARVRGQVMDDPRLSPPQKGAFASLSYEPPGTLFTLELSEIEVDGHWRSASGSLLVKVREAEHRVRRRATIEATGWLAQIRGPMNPGEFDFKSTMAQRGVVGRLTLHTRGNWHELSPPGALDAFAHLREGAAEACAESLALGMRHPPAPGDDIDAHREAESVRLGFLNLILLGRRSGAFGELHESFKRIGLAHLLSISGAHLAILLGMVWLVVRLLVPHPPRAALVVLVVLVLYMIAVPWRTPIVRAGLMAGLMCLGAMSGRRVRGIDMVSVAAMIVLLWKPDDIFNAGFQLSFGVVAGLLIFTHRVSQWLYADPLIITPEDQWRIAMLRRGADYLAVNVVAFAIAMPVVAYHFQIITPMSILLSLLALPAATIVLGLGYLKIVVGLILPSGGMLLAFPLTWVADIVTNLAAQASRWPGSAVDLVQPPSLAWVAATLGVMLLLISGYFQQRRIMAGACVAICLTWLWWGDGPVRFIESRTDRVAMRVNMFAVGDGSCFLIRVHEPGEPRPFTIMFDCGSQGYWDLSIKSIAPALHEIGVERIDLLFLSHADIDHFGGSIDLIDAVRVDRVVMSAYLHREAMDDLNALAAAQAAGRKARPSAPALLLRLLHERNMPIDVIGAGWSKLIGATELEVIWPPPDLPDDTIANDTSLVLRCTSGVQVVMMCGDVQQLAIPALIARQVQGEVDLHASVSDLPHHGSFVDESPRFIEMINPRVVLQSSGPARLRKDKWQAYLPLDGSPTRLVTDIHGMCEVVLYRDGEVEWATLR